MVRGTRNASSFEFEEKENKIMKLTSSEKRKKVVAYVLSREGKNKYTRSDKRELVDEGYSDCSSLQRRAYEEIDMNIGYYTGSQITKGEFVQLGGELPDESKMQPGDELFFAADYDNGRLYNVGHIEMYVGNGQISGHGSGIGPTRKNMIKYCQQRNAAGKKFIGVKRYIPNDGSEEKDTTIVVPDTPMFIGECTGDDVNVRKGPGTSYGVITEWPKLNKGNMVEVLEKIGTWYMVRIAGTHVGYVYERYILKVVEEPAEDTMDILSRKPQWVGKVTADLLNVRSWAGASSPRIKSWPLLGKNNLVDVCDVVKAANGDDWYYIRIDGRIYGFVSAKYIARV